MSRATFVIIGQSNGGFYGNYAWSQYGAGMSFWNIHTGQCRSAYDPLPGWTIPPGSNTGGSIWSRLGYLLANEPDGPRKPWDQVVFAPIVVYGSPSSAWRPGESAYPRIAQTRAALAALGLSITAYLWMNGETDGIWNCEPGQHASNVTAMVEGIRADGDTAPLFAARCTLCRLDPHGLNCGANFELLTPVQRLQRQKQEAQIRREQERILVDLASLGVHDGPDLDRITTHARWDYCHLSNTGQFLAAEMWRETLLAAAAASLI